MHANTANPVAGFATEEAALSLQLPTNCALPFYGYRIIVDPAAGGSSEPALYIASQTCWDDVHHASLFVRGLNRCTTWQRLQLPEITTREEYRSLAGPNEAALRWIEPNLLRPGNVLVGTTDMNSKVGTFTGRIFEIERPFTAACPN
jgi:hypothetical protein